MSEKGTRKIDDPCPYCHPAPAVEGIACVAEVKPRPDDPSCCVCGALMTPSGYKCLSCGARISPQPAVEWEEIVEEVEDEE